MQKITADVICRALVAIIAALRKEYGLPEYKNVTISMTDNIAETKENGIMKKTE